MEIDSEGIDCEPLNPLAETEMGVGKIHAHTLMVSCSVESHGSWKPATSAYLTVTCVGAAKMPE